MKILGSGSWVWNRVWVLGLGGRVPGSPICGKTGGPAGRMVGWPGGKVAGWPDGRVGKKPGGRVDGWPGARASHQANDRKPKAGKPHGTISKV